MIVQRAMGWSFRHLKVSHINEDDDWANAFASIERCRIVDASSPDALDHGRREAGAQCVHAARCRGAGTAGEHAERFERVEVHRARL